MKTEAKKRAVFFDRDGVIFKPIVMDGRPRAPHSIVEYKTLSGIMPGAKEAVEKVKALGFLAILVTNQPDIAYGVISKKEWEWVQSQLSSIPFDDIFICFHRRDDNCECMKPKPGMLLEAEKKWNINLAKSFMVGDTESDVLVAKEAGCKSILVDAPYNSSVSSDMRTHSLSELSNLLS
ncbi:MAG: HAD-IIIA family hydrolase [bacterium]|nr:HAD-IIIA family hydrolase [bacterium]